MNPLDEFLLAKHGDGFMHSVGDALAEGAGTAVAGAAVAGVGIAASKVWDAVTKQRDFKQMLSSPFNADLHEHYQSRPKEFNYAFSSLRQMNPEFSKDPMVSGTYMRRMMGFDPTQAGGVLVEALSHRGEFPDSPMEAVHSEAVSGASKGFSESRKNQRKEVSEKAERGYKAQENQQKEEQGLRQQARAHWLSGGKGGVMPATPPDPGVLQHLRHPAFR